MKSGFISPLVIRDESTDSEVRFVLVEDLIYNSALTGTTLRAPAGMVTDFASIPRFLWRLLPPSGSAYDAPAVIHDKLYREQVICGRPITRDFADSVFGEAMQSKQVSIWKRHMILFGLKLGGWVVWNNYTRRKKPK